MGAEVIDLTSGERKQVGAQVVVNAAGPWAKGIASMARVDLPIALGRGAMVAMASRLVNTVVNRCKPPSDGDILVPVGTVLVLGTTDEAVQSPDDLTIAPWEVDLLLAEAEVLVPGIATHRALRAWSGIRPLYRPTPASGAETRGLPRAHTILDHATTHGVSGLVSVIGGKLTTFRLMAEEVMRVVAPKLGAEHHRQNGQHTPRTRRTHVPSAPAASRAGGTAVPGLPGIDHSANASSSHVPRLSSPCDRLKTPDLDDLRRDLRLGMGPCQAAFCGYRAAGLSMRTLASAPADGGLGAFQQERWRGLRPLAWGQTIRQIEFGRRVMAELLGFPGEGEDE